MRGNGAAEMARTGKKSAPRVVVEGVVMDGKNGGGKKLYLAVLPLAFVWLKRTTTTYFVTTRRVEIETGMLGRSTKEVRIGDIRADAGPVPLRATSDSGLAVEYHVAHGPAVIDNGKLRLTEIPARASYPIEVKVVACQFGRGLAPLVKTAAPVEQIVRIQKP